MTSVEYPPIGANIGSDDGCWHVQEALSPIKLILNYITVSICNPPNQYPLPLYTSARYQPTHLSYPLRNATLCNERQHSIAVNVASWSV